MRKTACPRARWALCRSGERDRGLSWRADSRVTRRSATCIPLHTCWLWWSGSLARPSWATVDAMFASVNFTNWEEDKDCVWNKDFIDRKCRSRGIIMQSLSILIHLQVGSKTGEASFPRGSKHFMWTRVFVQWHELTWVWGCVGVIWIVVKDCTKTFHLCRSNCAIAEVAQIGEIEDALRWFCWQLHQLCSNASPSAPLPLHPRSCS